MDKICETHSGLERLFLEIKEKFYERNKHLFLDVHIDCGSIILPAHKYVLSWRSAVLAEKLSNGVDQLNWTDYEANIGIALLRWIYTDKIHLDNDTIALGLLRASNDFQLASLFETCERTLIASVNESKSLEYHGIAKAIGANRLVEKCLELNSNCSVESPVKLQTKADKSVSTDHCHCREHCPCSCVMDTDPPIATQITNLFEEVTKVNKMTTGLREFFNFSDRMVLASDYVWPAHKFFLSTRSKIICAELEGDDPISFDGDIKNILLRWLYTDVAVLDDDVVTLNLLEASHYYQLPTLFERCEEALVQSATISSCASLHSIATRFAASKLLNRCLRLISLYSINFQLPEMSNIDMESEVDSDISMCETTAQEIPSQDAEGLLILNDDCLFHLFHYLSLVDLASLKDTCQRLSQLADESFKRRNDKSLTIDGTSMFADVWNLKHFGKFIDSLTLVGVYKPFASYDDIFAIIASCTNVQLRSMSLRLDFDKSLTDESFKLLEKVMANVECIELDWLDNDMHIDLLLGYCKNLKDVRLKGELLVLKGQWYSQNVNITRLILNSMLDDNFLEEIGQHLTHLECLVIDYVENASNKFNHLGQLNHLKKLKIGMSSGGSMQQFRNFAANSVLEYLCLSFMELSAPLAQALKDFSHLKELVFEWCDGFDGNVRTILSKTLVNIEKIAFVDCEDITLDDITKIVEKRSKLKELSIYRCDKIKAVDNSNYLRLRKKRNLELFLDKGDCDRSLKLIGNSLSNYVRVTAKPWEWSYYSD